MSWHGAARIDISFTSRKPFCRLFGYFSAEQRYATAAENGAREECEVPMPLAALIVTMATEAEITNHLSLHPGAGKEAKMDKAEYLARLKKVCRAAVATPPAPPSHSIEPICRTR